ncbi:glycosyltransferase family 2 protein [Bacillus sp. B1-b2]|uniref:glycosyltransferase family 2 protein n=1 Tax=Bacillus sp. B1-b2 TaxID=2653201 RepID=UPI001261B051|nr:glycosyltransferase [Bacillus sp. B1-b2]KAB7671724.1 glycosyltransferase [Bacillus sp. B1-b2]
MKRDGIISVAITTHKRALFLDQALESVYNQTLLPDEIVISEDGQDPETSKILEKYIEKNKEIHMRHIINNPPLKQLNNRQKAISSTTGEYVAMLDDDDKWENTFLEKTFKALSKNVDCHFCSTDHYFMDESGVVLKEQSEEFSTYSGRDKMAEGMYKDVFLLEAGNNASIFSLQHTLFRKSILDEVGYFQVYGGLVPDYILFLTLGAKKTNVYFIPERLGYCRIHSGQQTKHRIDNVSSKVEGLMGIYNNYRSVLTKQENKLLKNKTADSIVERSIAFLHGGYKWKAIDSIQQLKEINYYRVNIKRLLVFFLLVINPYQLKK